MLLFTSALGQADTLVAHRAAFDSRMIESELLHSIFTGHQLQHVFYLLYVMYVPVCHVMLYWKPVSGI